MRAVLFIILLLAGITIVAQSDSSAINADIGSDKNINNGYLAVSRYIKLKGVVQGGYIWNDASDFSSSFYLGRARLDFTGEVARNLTYRLQLEFVGSPKILNAEISYQLSDYIQFNFGQTKTPYCYDNYFNPFTLPSISRTLLDQSLSGRVLDLYGNQQGRDIGVWINGEFENNANRPIAEYTLGIYNGSGITITDNNNQKDIGGALRFSPLENVWLSGRFYKGTGETVEYINVPTSRKRYGGDFSYKKNKVMLEAEYLFGEDSSDSLGVLKRSGWYFTTGYMPIEDKLQVVLRLDTFNNNLVMDENTTYRYIAASSWFFTKYSRIQLEYGFSDEAENESNMHQIILQLQAGF